MIDRLDCAIHRIQHLSTSEKLILHGLGLNEQRFRRLSRHALLEMGLGRPQAGKDFSPETLFDNSERDIRWAAGKGCSIIPIWHPYYPRLLREVYEPPFLIFIRQGTQRAQGDLAYTFNLDIVGNYPFCPAVSVVGTRTPSSAGARITYGICRDLSAKGVITVSGLARGIDSAVHQAAVDHGARTIGFLGHGPDLVYPRMNAKLAAGILHCGGALISEYPPGTPPRPFRFPQRNRLISGVSAAVLMAEAPEKSGALITVDFALEQGRDVMILSGLEDSRRNEGGRALERNGAVAVSTAAELLQNISPDLLFPSGVCRQNKYDRAES